MSSSLAVYLFGPPQVILDGKPLKLDRRKTLALLAWLAAGTNPAHPPGRRPQPGSSRETLATLLWPDCSQDQAAAYLRQALWDFSKAAGEGWILREGSMVWLRESVVVDVQQFERLLARWKSAAPGDPAGQVNLEEAVSLYNGDFLAGFSLRDCPAFEQWQTLRAEGLHLALGEALEALARLKFQQGATEDALAAARRWLALDELNEAAHRELMRLYADSGRLRAALQQYEDCQRTLQEELGVAPEIATVQLAQQISTHRTPAQVIHPIQEPPLPVSLPPQATPFVGRESELDRIQAMLDDPECRLVSLVGPGGSGKTRLAIQAAGASIGQTKHLNFPNGIYFAGLASAASEADALSAIAGALRLEFRIEFSSSLPLDSARKQLLNYLANKKCLLVLDNLEQMVGSASLLSIILATAPGVKLIVTTQERLNLPEEWVLEVPGLDFPPEKQEAFGDDPAAIYRYTAIQLFLKGAGRAGGFTPHADDWPAIARIVQLVEGLPLGVELASAWVKMLSCHEIANEMAHSLDFLETSWPDAPERQRSLRAVFDYSWRLLSENEREVLQRLSVFRGGFTREAAYAISDAALARLAALADKSLVRRISSGRFDLHELVKQFAGQKLAAVPAALSETEERHARYYASWLRQKSEGLKGSEQFNSLDTLRTEKHNVRRAWDWLIQKRENELLLNLLPNLILFFEMDGEHATAREMMARLVKAVRGSGVDEPAGETEMGLLSMALAGLRYFSRDSGDLETSSCFQSQSLALAHRMPPGKARAHIYLMNISGPNTLPVEELIGLCQESVDIFQETGDGWGTSLSLLILADTVTFSRSDPEFAESTYQKSLEGFTRLGNDWGRALCFFGLGVLAGFSGQLEEAGLLLRQSLDIYLQLGMLNRVFDTRQTLGQVATALGQNEQARQLFLANLAYAQQTGDRERIQNVQDQLAHLSPPQELSGAC